MHLKRKPQQLAIAALASATIEAGMQVSIALDRQQYLWGVMVDYYARLTIAGGAGAAVNAEGILGVFRRFRVTQNHEIFNSKQRVNKTPASLFRQVQALNGTAGLAACTPALAVGMAAYDIHVQFVIPFVLLGLPERLTVPFLCDAPRAGTLNLEIDFGVGHDLVTSGGATTYTWANFGGGGNPRLEVTLLQVNGLKHLPKTGMIAYLDRVDSLAGAVAIDNQIGQQLTLDGGLARLWLKQYVTDPLGPVTLAAVMNSPNTQAATGLVHPQISVDRAVIREANTWASLEAEDKFDFQQEAWPAGYGCFDFVEDKDLREVIPVADMIKSGHIISVGGLNNALANGQLEQGYELIYPNPTL